MKLDVQIVIERKHQYRLFGRGLFATAAIASLLTFSAPILDRIECSPSKREFPSSNLGGATTWEKYIATGYAHGCVRPRSGKEWKHPRKGANGKWPIPNETVAADPSIPFGTKLKFFYRGKLFTMTVGDRGHDIKGKRLDIFFETCEQAIRFGRKELYVKILND